ncbi:hypothetical protein PGT21_034275 [Puccinia graminis f. sp. tritici]|uniref:Uncharacterized protein n=1 Tax=Puccinia graminis f. sp. tritici TaxID=56615 RepID=A0A5B0LNT1_PUCGR|nr:hypothetical protein PGT21_034275 [Puccinia graminis f. sp. tritici]
MGDAFKAPRRFRLEGDLESARQTLSTRIKVASKLTWERSTGGSRFGGDLKNHPRRLVTGFKAVCKPTWKRSRHDGRLQVVFEMKLQPHLSCTLGGRLSCRAFHTESAWIGTIVARLNQAGSRIPFKG